MPKSKSKRGGDGEKNWYESFTGTAETAKKSLSSLYPFASKKPEEGQYASNPSTISNNYSSQPSFGGRRKRRSKKRRSMRGGDFTDNTETGLASTAAPFGSADKMFGGKRKTKRRSRKNKRSTSKSRRR